MAKEKKERKTAAESFGGGFFNEFYGFFSRMLKLKNKTVRTLTSDYMPVAGLANPYTFFDENFNLISLFEIKGAYNMRGPSDIDRIEDMVRATLANILREQGVSIQFVIVRDKENIHRDVDKVLRPLVNKAVSLGMGSLETVVTERFDKMKKNMVSFKIYVGVTSNPSRLLTKERREQEMEQVLKGLGPNFPPNMPEGNKFYLQPHINLTVHESLVESIEKMLKDDVRVNCTLLDAHEAIYEWRQLLFPNETPLSWQARLGFESESVGVSSSKKKSQNAEDKVYRDQDVCARRLGEGTTSNPNDLSGYGPPSIKRQLAAGAIDRGDKIDSIIKFGSRYVATTVLTELPLVARTFDDFFSDIKGEVPFRLSITLIGGADEFISKVNSKKTSALLAAVLTTFGVGKINIAISKACEKLNEMYESGIPLAGFDIQLSTWADDKIKCEENIRILENSLARWGNPIFLREQGDPALAFTAGVPGWNNQLRNTLIHGFDYLAKSLPYQILTSPWLVGSTAFLNKQNTMCLYQQNSTVQQSWALLGFSPPGGGKSVMISALVMAAILDTSQEGMPKIAAIDVGNSLLGMVNLLKKACGKNQKQADRIKHIQFEFSDRFVINVFDLRVGNQYPMTDEKVFLVDFVTAIIRGVAPQKQEALRKLAELLVSETYAHNAEKLFEPERCAEITEFVLSTPQLARAYQPPGTLTADGKPFVNNLTWHGVVVAAVNLGREDIARKANLYFSPTFEDLLGMFTLSDNLRSAYQKEDDISGKELSNEGQRAIASFINTYTSLKQTSSFDLGDVDVCVIDLNKVATGDVGDANSLSPISVAYMVSRYILGKDILLGGEILDDANITKAAKIFLEPKVAKLKTVKKYFFYDELHTIGKISPMWNVILGDIRKGRKANLSVGVFSQIYEDFPIELRDVITVRFVLRVDKESEMRGLCEAFGWDDTVYNSLRMDVRGAGKQHASFLMDASGLADEGNQSPRMTQVLYNYVGATELACYSTFRYDAAIISTLTEQYGVDYWDAVTLMGRIYGGSIKPHLEKDIEIRNKQLKDLTEKESATIIDPYVERLLIEHKKMHQGN